MSHDNNPQEYDSISETSSTSEKSISGFETGQINSSSNQMAVPKEQSEEAKKVEMEAVIKNLQQSEEKKPDQKTYHLGDNLSQYELNLYEYSAFSLMEEIDIFYCKQ